jgi:hypothetical protein
MQEGVTLYSQALVLHTLRESCSNGSMRKHERACVYRRAPTIPPLLYHPSPCRIVRPSHCWRCWYQPLCCLVRIVQQRIHEHGCFVGLWRFCLCEECKPTVIFIPTLEHYPRIVSNCIYIQFDRLRHFRLFRLSDTAKGIVPTTVPPCSGTTRSTGRSAY